MQVRDAVHTDVQDIAELLERHCRGKAELAVCRSRAGTAVKLARRPSSQAEALVVERGNAIEGFLFARPEEAWELLTHVRFMYIYFLVGTHAARPLLRELRARTKMRLVLNTWNAIASDRALTRLLRSEGFRAFGRIHAS